ncbi:MAG TPA: hypothetical protein VI111_04245 [Thermoleophilaceae bacterium]
MSWSPRLPRAAAALAAVAGLAVVAVPAAAATRDLPLDGPLAAVPAHVPDRVISKVTVAGAARAPSTARTHSYRTSDGQQVEVAVSSAYPVDDAADRALVEFLATRVHGPELGALRLYVGRPAEVSSLCGGGRVVACYATDEARMYVPGEDTPEVPMGYVITHEYGHHIASWRRNDPWDALDWGPKYWSSSVGVCAGVARHQLFPGNQGRHYFDDPGEGFADGYAHMHYPSESWRYNRLLRPDAAVFDAIRRDVSAPWSGPRTKVLEARRAGHLRVRLALDGDVTVHVSGRPGARFKFQLRSADWAIGRKLKPGGRLGIQWCRKTPSDATLHFSVRRVAGSGPVRLTVRYPG